MVAKRGLGPVKALWKTRDKYLASVKREERRIRTDLARKVPRSMAKWQKKTIVFDAIFKYGHTFPKYYSENLDEYGFESLDDCLSKMSELGAAWSGIVEVSAEINLVENRVEVSMEAV